MIRPQPPARLLITAVRTASCTSLCPAAPPLLIEKYDLAARALLDEALYVPRSDPALFEFEAEEQTAEVGADDLEVLKQARVETLQIERAASFLESLKNAVDRAKATL